MKEKSSSWQRVIVVMILSGISTCLTLLPFPPFWNPFLSIVFLTTSTCLVIAFVLMLVTKIRKEGSVLAGSLLGLSIILFIGLIVTAILSKPHDALVALGYGTGVGVGLGLFLMCLIVVERDARKVLNFVLATTLFCATMGLVWQGIIIIKGFEGWPRYESPSLRLVVIVTLVACILLAFAGVIVFRVGNKMSRAREEKRAEKEKRETWKMMRRTDEERQRRCEHSWEHRQIQGVYLTPARGKTLDHLPTHHVVCEKCGKLNGSVRL